MAARPGPRASRPRSEARYGPERGDTYLIHFSEKFQHARHYRGWTPRTAAARFADHLAGRGAKLTAEAAAAGIGMKLARVWPDTTRDYEDAIKHQGGSARLCPDCGAPCAPPRLATGTPRPEAERDPTEGLSWYEQDRLGVDTETGELLPIVTTYPTPAAADAAPREETQMFGQERRAAARRTRESERARMAAHAEANRLAALADQIDMQAGRMPWQPLPMPAERAARVRDYIAPALVRDARAHAPEPVLKGAGLAAEIDRLATAYDVGEWYDGRDGVTPPEPDGVFYPADPRMIAEQRAEAEAHPGPSTTGYAAELTAETWPGHSYADRHAEAEAREAEADRQAAVRLGELQEARMAQRRAEDRRMRAAGIDPGPDEDLRAAVLDDLDAVAAAARPADAYTRYPAGSEEHRAAYEAMRERDAGIGYGGYEVDNAEELAADRYYEEQADQHFREMRARAAAGDREAGEALAELPEWLRADPEPEIEGPGDEPGPDAARWAGEAARSAPEGLTEEIGAVREQAGQPYRGGEPGGFAELLERHLGDVAIRAEAARRLENRALAAGRIAAREGDRPAAGDARERAQDAEAARRDAGAEAYVTAADLQADAFEADEDLAEDFELDDYPLDAGMNGPAPDHLYGAPECDEGNPEVTHFGWNSPEARDRGQQCLPVVERTLAAPGAWRDLAPAAVTLPDGTPHASPFLAERGWQAQDGIYARAPQAQAEAG